MAIDSQELLNAIHQLSKEQVHQAGQRYTPGIDPAAPNIQVESLITAIQNAACGVDARNRFKIVLKDFRDVWKRAESSSQHTDEIRDHLTQAETSIDDLIKRLRAGDTEASTQWVTILSNLEALLDKDLAHWREEEAKLTEAERSDRYGKQGTIFGHLSSINSCISVLRSELEFMEAPAFRVLSNPFLLITGEWGTGKTHLMCDVTLNRIGLGHPTLLILAKNFKTDILFDITERIHPGSDIETILDQIHIEAGRLGERAIIICEGINEGRRREWPSAVKQLKSLVTQRTNIALVITCRTPFEEVSILKSDLEQFEVIHHPGFGDQEFDAQAAFFQYYQLPLPEVPLLDQEFARPLTLKLICQSLQNLSGKKLAKGFSGIASGQRGMTYVLESFVNQIGKPIETEFSLAHKGCWLLLKGNKAITDKKEAGFAACMAETSRGYVLRSEADRIISRNYPNFKPARRKALLEALRVNGIIEEDVIWYRTSTETKSRIVYRLPYQRFSDHLIARHLLESFLDTSSRKTIEASFAEGTPLGNIFKQRRFNSQYAEPGWAQALITEFPERAKKHLPDELCELYFVLPDKARNTAAYCEPFIEGMFWRDPKSFNEGTRRLINHCLNNSKSNWEKIVDALAAVSTKPDHPYSASRLYSFLSRFTMADRDLSWSEYLRRKYASPTIHRLLTWAEEFNGSGPSEAAAKELITLFSLILTTVVRKDRDLATRALVFLGEKFPAILFEHALLTLKFNDPYVSERMLAAAYGVAMSLTDSEGAADFNPILGKFARNIYLKMFGPRARFTTHHALKRDYALGIIELAQRAQCVTLPKAAPANLSAPFPYIVSPFKEGAADPATQEAIGDPIYMDFGNYTIGRLIPHRSNYDMDNPIYQDVRNKIERRIFDLGYSKDKFQETDREIGRYSYRGSDEHKVDRYGKKYSWIAYFEMWGVRQALKQLPEWRSEKRPSDCDIDPSFPKRPPQWTPPIPDMFGDLTIDTTSWVGGNYTPILDPLLSVPEINGHAGPWILIEGNINIISEDAGREIFALIRGMFLTPKEVPVIRDEFLNAEYPGNDLIPEGNEEHYLYAGEIGRRGNYAPYLLNKNGTYRRQLRSAFNRYVRHEEDPVTPILPFKILVPGGSEEETFEFDLTPRGEWVPGIRVELPTISFGWESYHSIYNDFSGFNIPAPSLIQKLKLSTKNREIDFYDSTGRPGILYRQDGSLWKGNRHQLTYIREDLLKSYLTKTRQRLVWCNWGERDWNDNFTEIHLDENSDRSKIYQGHKNIHRSFQQWPFS